MRIVDGAIAGATGAVSMMLARPAIERARIGRRDQESEWERVFRTQARRAGYRPSRTVIRIAGSAAHLAYGASLGALFAALAGSRRVRPVLAGVPYGLALWYANYSKPGLLARLGALPPRRKSIPLAHHVVFGIATAVVYSLLGTFAANNRMRSTYHPQLEGHVADPKSTSGNQGDQGGMKDKGGMGGQSGKPGQSGEKGTWSEADEMKHGDKGRQQGKTGEGKSDPGGKH